VLVDTIVKVMAGLEMVKVMKLINKVETDTASSHGLDLHGVHLISEHL
jgi:hypothetical protein